MNSRVLELPWEPNRENCMGVVRECEDSGCSTNAKNGGRHCRREGLSQVYRVMDAGDQR